MNSNKLDKFCHRHDIDIIESKPSYRKSPLPTKFFTDPSDYNIIDESSYKTFTEPLLIISIPESQLKQIAEFEAQAFNHLEQRGHYNLFEKIMEQKQQEQFFRDNYPAVKKAYEHYSLMLNMASSGEL
jgi:hypothetical protein